MPKPETGGAAALPTAPTERVLWSQEWSVGLEDESVRSMTEGDQISLELHDTEECRFGSEPTPSGVVTEYPYSPGCRNLRPGSQLLRLTVWSGSKPIGVLRSTEAVGFAEAVQGHTVLRMRRSQTYEVWLLSNGTWTYDYADFTGKWEAIGY